MSDMMRNDESLHVAEVGSQKCTYVDGLHKHYFTQVINGQLCECGDMQVIEDREPAVIKRVSVRPVS